MCEKKQYENLPHMAGLLRKAAEQSYDLLNNLLEWSRAQSGRKKIKPQRLNLCTSLTDTISLVSLSAHPKNLEIVAECDEEIFVFADADVLNTIVRNLLGNAVKFSHPKHKIYITAHKLENEVLISVKDEGVGMDEEHQKKLFKIGEAIIKPGTNEERGTGLGLILCKEFIEMHGGKIWFDSELNVGTTFYFSLPLKEELAGVVTC
jgi:signal transduction histidine kinase